MKKRCLALMVRHPFSIYNPVRYRLMTRRTVLPFCRLMRRA